MVGQVIEADARPLPHHYPTASADWRHEQVTNEYLWGNAVHRVAADGISPEQAVEEATARMNQILSE